MFSPFRINCGNDFSCPLLFFISLPLKIQQDDINAVYLDLHFAWMIVPLNLTLCQSLIRIYPHAPILVQMTLLKNPVCEIISPLQSLNIIGRAYFYEQETKIP